MNQIEVKLLNKCSAWNLSVNKNDQYLDDHEKIFWKLGVEQASTTISQASEMQPKCKLEQRSSLACS